MKTFIVIVGLCLIGTGELINRPVYKVKLTQKGFAQFLQYDIEAPPLVEFTFCVWISISDLKNDQTIFTYVAHGNNRVVRLWVENGGSSLKLSMNGRPASSVPVMLERNSWRHVCLSYQSDFGAWALYLDGRLLTCEASQILHGLVLPGGGSVIVGYGTSDLGTPNGFQGELFGANMILSSSIERNHTSKHYSQNEQKQFTKDKVKFNGRNIKYIIFNELKPEIINQLQKNAINNVNKRVNDIMLSPLKPYRSTEHDVGLDISDKREQAESKEFLDFSLNTSTTDKNKINFWQLVNKEGRQGKFKKQEKIATEQSGSGTHDLPTISVVETPPPLEASNQEYYEKGLEMERPPVTDSVYNSSWASPSKEPQSPKGLYDIETPPPPSSNFRPFKRDHQSNEIYEMETPPLPQSNTKVYGQWTSSKYAGTVLNYLKSINFNTREKKKVPNTIPLPKYSDAFPYASDFKLTKVRAPLKFQRKNFADKTLSIVKREIPEINVQILEDDLRKKILKMHAKTMALDVEITSRGDKKDEDRFCRNVAPEKTSEENQHGEEDVYKPKPFSFEQKTRNQHGEEDVYKPKPFSFEQKTRNRKLANNVFNAQKTRKLQTILPFLKSVDYYLDTAENNDNLKSATKDDMYTKTLSSANKWHNVKSFNNDYTPRKISIDCVEPDDPRRLNSSTFISQPYINLHYKHIKNSEKGILKGRKLAMALSDAHKSDLDAISIFRYNHGSLPGHEDKLEASTVAISTVKGPRHPLEGKHIPTGSFNKPVKIGNALNERYLIGLNDEDKKQSFVGGDEKIPDINRYRSDIDKINDKQVPPSLSPRVCKNLELYDRVLYIQPDGSIDMTHILSPVRAKNQAIEFIIENYKKCSLIDSKIEKSPLLFINWDTTPVRLFGGAYPIRTRDLCGFF